MERFLKSKLENGCFSNVSAKRSRIMSAIRGKRNKSTELPLRMAFVREGIKGWVLHSTKISGKPDFYFPVERVAIFVDGCFWHGCPDCGHVPRTRTAFWKAKIERNQQRDQRTQELLSAMGVRTIRIWEHALRDQANLRTHILRIQQLLNP